MIDLPKGTWFYLPDTAPLSLDDPRPFPTWARKRPPPWEFMVWLRKTAVGPAEYPLFQRDAVLAEAGDIRERDDYPEGFIVWRRAPG